MQLPPVCVCEKAARDGLRVSLFDRLLTENPRLHPEMLCTQFRMHPLIRMWPSRAFYSNRLEDGVAADQRPPPDGFPWPAAGPVAFLDVAGQDSAAEHGKSKKNEEEAKVVLFVVRLLVSHGLPARDIGVISPYVAQTARVKQLIQASPAKESLEDIEVKTVDGFQGREKEVIVFSAVRANVAGELGFVADHRRLNVAITRPRRGLVVIGNAATLASDEVWGAWLKFVGGKGLSVPPPGAEDF